MKREEIETLTADDVRIGLNPAVTVVQGRPSRQSLTMEFHTTEEGWIRIRLERDMCDLFNARYKEHTLGGIKE
jgi:hypothetical protein